MEAPDRIRLLEDRTLGHAAVLVERLIFWSRHLGLMSRFNHDEDPLGPLCVNDDEVSTMLASLRRSRGGQATPGDPLVARACESRARLRELLTMDELRGLGLIEIVRSFALGDEELDAFVLALAPDWDARFGRLFGFLNNDLSRQRPTVAHLQLLSSRPHEAARSPLLAVETSPLPLPARGVQVLEHVVDISRGPVCAAPPGTRSWASLQLAPGDRAQLQETLDRELRRRVGGHRLVVLEAHPGSGRRTAALAAATAAGRGTIYFDVETTARNDRSRAVAGAMLRGRLTGAAVIARLDGGTASSAEALGEIAREAEQLSLIHI